MSSLDSKCLRPRFGTTSLRAFLAALSFPFLLSIWTIRAASASSMSPSSLSALDAATLRSLGVTESQIRSIAEENDGEGGSSSKEVDSNIDEEDKVQDLGGEAGRVEAEQPKATGSKSNEEWRSKDDWWKDPLAQFDDDEGTGSIFKDTDSSVKNKDDERRVPIDESEISKVLMDNRNQRVEEEVGFNNELPDETKRRLAAKSIIPSRGGRTRSSALATRGMSSTTRGNSFSTPAIPALLLPSIMPRMKKSLEVSPPVVRLAALVVAMKFVVTRLRSLRGQRQSEEVGGGKRLEDFKDELDDMEERAREAQEEREWMEREYQSSIPARSAEEAGVEGGGDEEVYDDEEEKIEPAADLVPRKRGLFPRIRLPGMGDRKGKVDIKKTDGLSSDGETAENGDGDGVTPDFSPSYHLGVSRGQGAAGKKSKLRQKRSSARELENARDAFRKRADSAESERDVMEREYEEKSRQLEELRIQMNNLESTARYLKSQLRDNQRMLEQAVQTERQKASDELARVREGMVTVLERERRLMRAQMMRHSAQARALLNEDNNDAPEEEEGQYEEGQYEEGGEENRIERE